MIKDIDDVDQPQPMEKSLMKDEPMESTAYPFDDVEMQENER